MFVVLQQENLKSDLNKTKQTNKRLARTLKRKQLKRQQRTGKVRIPVLMSGRLSSYPTT